MDSVTPKNGMMTRIGIQENLQGVTFSTSLSRNSVARISFLNDIPYPNYSGQKGLEEGKGKL